MKLPENRDAKISQEDVKSYYNHFLNYLKRDHECANPRHQRAKETLRSIIKPGMKVLDIGCGTGITSRFMGELGANVVGVDISDKLIAFAQSSCAHKNVRYIVADATQLNLGKKFDTITIIDSLEHILRRKLDDYFRAISRHVSEETIMYLNIPDGRYQRHMRLHHPERLQIVDEDYDPDFLISSFRKIGFQPCQILIYGIDVPVQYNEYIFMTEHRLKKIYEKALKKLGL